MRRIIQITLLAALVLLCITNAVLVRFLYVRYADSAGRIAGLEARMSQIEQSMDLNWRWSTRTITTEIVTGPSDSRDFGEYTLHLNSHTNGVQRFELKVGKEVGHPVAAWVSQWSPHSEMLKFEEFRVAPNPETGKIDLYATARANESIDMRFTISVLEQSFAR